MRKNEIGITLPVDGGLSANDLINLGIAAENQGFDYVVCGEVAGVDAPIVLGAILKSTDKIKVATGIIATTLRTPQMAAMSFGTLSSIGPGRVSAGFGASSPIIVNAWHGRPFEKPLLATKEFIEVFKLALTKERVVYKGEIYSSNGFVLQVDPVEPIPIWLAAINRKMLELAGELADGVFLTWCPPSEVLQRLDSVSLGASKANRRLTDVSVICSFWAYTGPDEQKALESARRTILAYAMVPTHQSAFIQSFPGLRNAALAWSSGDRKSALREVDDEVVHRMCAIGSPQHVVDRIDEFHSQGVNLAIVLPISLEYGDATVASNTFDALGIEIRRRRMMTSK